MNRNNRKHLVEQLLRCTDVSSLIRIRHERPEIFGADRAHRIELIEAGAAAGAGRSTRRRRSPTKAFRLVPVCRRWRGGLTSALGFCIIGGVRRDRAGRRLGLHSCRLCRARERPSNRVGRAPTRLKLLAYDGTGIILATKWLESGRFVWPRSKTA